MTSEVKPRVVYKIVRSDKPEDGTDVYVGSTSQPLRKRLVEHRKDAKLCDTKLYRRMLKIGVYNWKIIPLLTFACDQETIREFERQWIIILNANLNMLLPLRENNEKNRESAKRHYRVSLETKRYYCGCCDMAFGNTSHLKAHLNTKKHKNKNFEQLIEGVHEMIQDGTFSQVLENSKETSL